MHVGLFTFSSITFSVRSLAESTGYKRAGAVLRTHAIRTLNELHS